MRAGLATKAESWEWSSASAQQQKTKSETSARPLLAGTAAETKATIKSYALLTGGCV